MDLGPLSGLDFQIPDIFGLFPFFDEVFRYLVSLKLHICAKHHEFLVFRDQKYFCLWSLSLPSFPEVAESSSPNWTFPTSARKLSCTSVFCTSALKVPKKLYFSVRHTLLDAQLHICAVQY